tara:strand:+ start:61 stop:267 length:207 start_codon:yes stop_codon:yes gene_type:complete
MNTANYTINFGRVVELVYTIVLGTIREICAGSSPVSPTTTATQWINVVAQGVALAITCCTKILKRSIF